ncbi:ring/u-box superfamily protein [Anaeramoeba flamelloides]|uniref:Ring/u-box superfamily protein n=1 Tax=Anaeramoeba flamelloides TaxID=1746091 RepID=A0ABQ8Z1X2_9EUKA|nr:ring/u-box superfamily protein [Anaeramoeba flamelloides]
MIHQIDKILILICLTIPLTILLRFFFWVNLLLFESNYLNNQYRDSHAQSETQTQTQPQSLTQTNSLTPTQTDNYSPPQSPNLWQRIKNSFSNCLESNLENRSNMNLQSYQEVIRSLSIINRDFNDLDYERLLNLDNYVVNKGLKKCQINRLPRKKYQNKINITNTDSEKEHEEKCMICLEKFSQGQNLTTLPCFE